MSNTFRPRRVMLSAVNSPTVSHIKKTSTLEKDGAEQFLSKFIEASEINASRANGNIMSEVSSSSGMSISTEGSTALSQLRRIQRDLRGLPPLDLESSTSNENKKTKFEGEDSSEGPKNKKIRFDDSEAEQSIDTKEAEEEEKETDIEKSKQDDNEVESEEELESEVEEEEEQQKQKEEELKEKENKKEKKDKKDKKEKKLKKEKKEKKDKKKSKSD